MNREYKWIIIREVGSSASGKTLVFEVVNKNYQNIPLGFIKWNNGYRKYAFYPEEDSYYDEGCLKDIANFLDELKNMIKKK